MSYLASLRKRLVREGVSCKKAAEIARSVILTNRLESRATDAYFDLLPILDNHGTADALLQDSEPSIGNRIPVPDRWGLIIEGELGQISLRVERSQPESVIVHWDCFASWEDEPLNDNAQFCDSRIYYWRRLCEQVSKMSMPRYYYHFYPVL